MKCKNTTSAKVLFGCFNALFFICGFVEVVGGFVVLSDSERLSLSRLLTSPAAGAGLQQPPLYYAALALLVSGLAASCVGALGCWASYVPGYFTLTVYFLVVLSLVLCECAGGVLVAVWPRCVGLHSARGGAAGALQAYYAVPDYEHFTAAVDLAQTMLHCCGMVDSRDYSMSAWQLRRLGPRAMTVPPTCCVQLAPPAPAHAAPEHPTPPAHAAPAHLNPAPAHPARCQELVADPRYRHVPGCIGKLEDWYQQQYTIYMIGLFVVALFKIGILLSTIFSCIQLRHHRRDKHSFIMKSIDNKTKENIYQLKVHDEPITAKYVQPNNFYSPRVRNPRIFHTKPNEMV